MGNNTVSVSVFTDQLVNMQHSNYVVCMYHRREKRDTCYILFIIFLQLTLILRLVVCVYFCAAGC